MKDYSSDIIVAKNKLSALLYAEVKILFKNNQKLDYRKAYEELSYIEKINPDYRDVRRLMREAY